MSGLIRTPSRVMTGLAAAAALSIPQPAATQGRQIGPIPAGTTVQVRTAEPIDSVTIDGRIYRGTIEADVHDSRGRLAIPANSPADLVVRRDAQNDLVLDLDAVTIDNRRYAVEAAGNRIESGDAGLGANKETARNVGGGAALGALLGAVIGGGDAAAAGAIVGGAAGAGVQILTKGRRVNVPSETLLSYRLESDISLDARD